MPEKEEEGCAGKSAGAPAVVKSPGDPLVEFKYPDNPTFDLVYLAEALGYFEGSRTRPKYVGKIAAPQIIPLVGIGEIDFGTRMVPLASSGLLFRQTSALALFPVFILFFGIGELSRMAIICWASFWPILLSLSQAWERGEIHACRYPGRPRKVSPSMVKML